MLTICKSCDAEFNIHEIVVWGLKMTYDSYLEEDVTGSGCLFTSLIGESTEARI